MIKFFRNIRKSLLNEGKTSKYFKYAIGEIILVVVGILIALQINNWNEAQTEKRVLNTQLTNLIDDLKLDSTRLYILDTISNFRYHSINYLLKMAGSNPYVRVDSLIEYTYNPSEIWKEKIPDAYDKNFIQLAFYWSGRIGRHSVNANAINELNNTGNLSNIKQDLKIQINEYYNAWSFYFNDEAEKYKEYWDLSLSEDGLTSEDLSLLDDPFNIIMNNPKRIGLLKVMSKECSWFLIGVERLKERNEQLISLLEKETNQ